MPQEQSAPIGRVFDPTVKKQDHGDLLPDEVATCFHQSSADRLEHRRRFAGDGQDERVEAHEAEREALGRLWQMALNHPQGPRTPPACQLAR